MDTKLHAVADTSAQIASRSCSVIKKKVGAGLPPIMTDAPGASYRHSPRRNRHLLDMAQDRVRTLGGDRHTNALIYINVGIYAALTINWSEAKVIA